MSFEQVDHAQTSSDQTMDTSLASSIGYAILEARFKGYRLIAHLLEVALHALERGCDCGHKP